MSEYELPLVFFTVFTQWGIGGVLALTLYQLNAGRKAEPVLSHQQIKYTALGLWLVEVLGSSLSMAHLGSPFEAYRVVLGLGHSWLSREAVLFIVLNGGMLLWLLACWFRPQNKALQSALGLVITALGIVAILSSAQIYAQMALHPLWHTPFTQVAFLGTPLLLGFTTLGIVLNACGLNVSRLIRGGMLAGIVMVLVALAGRYQIDGASTLGVLLWWQICGSILIAAAMFTLLRTRVHLSPTLAIVAGAMIVSGEVVGRMLFYNNVMSQFPWC